MISGTELRFFFSNLHLIFFRTDNGFLFPQRGFSGNFSTELNCRWKTFIDFLLDIKNYRGSNLIQNSEKKKITIADKVEKRENTSTEKATPLSNIAPASC